MQETEIHEWLEYFCMEGHGWEFFRKLESGYEIYQSEQIAAESNLALRHRSSVNVSRL